MSLEVPLCLRWDICIDSAASLLPYAQAAYELSWALRLKRNEYQSGGILSRYKFVHSFLYIPAPKARRPAEANGPFNQC